MTTVTERIDEERGPRIVHGPDSPIAEIVRTCRRIAASDATVLLTGETGTGKEVFARHIHENSPRAKRPLVAVNCAAIPEALLESELFGHVRGAFTGAFQSRRGRIAAADGGTLFLDEIGELPLALQAKLLRVLQERCYEPVGATEPVPADFRLVAATNRDLTEEIKAGRFRRDLYYRILVCPIEVPPLRERKGDASRLFLHFWRTRGERRPIDPAVFEALEAYEWPGNVRELENLVERLSVCAEGQTIRITDLPPSMRARRANAAGISLVPAPDARADAEAPPCADPSPAPAAPAEPEAPRDAAPDPRAFRFADDAPIDIDPALHDGHAVDLPRILRRLEDAYIDAALARTSGNKKAAADLLGLQRTTLVEKLRRRNRGPDVANVA